MLSFDWIREKTGLKPVFFLVLGMVFYALKTFCIAYAPNIAMVLLGSTLQGLSFAVFLPASVAFLMEAVDRKYLATAQMTAVTIGSSLAAIISNPAGGAIADSLGVQNMLKLMGVPAVLGALLMTVCGRFFCGPKFQGLPKEANRAENPA